MITKKKEKDLIKEVNLKVYKDIEEFNKKELIDKSKKISYEKVKDKELVKSILDKEKRLR